MTAKAPGRAFAHLDARIKGAGGTLGDSRRGSKIARTQGRKWIDCNGHLMHRTTLGLQRAGIHDLELWWVNAHGAPFNPRWLGKSKFEALAWDKVHPAHPLLRDALETFKQNAALDLSTEWEVKDLHPLASGAQLEHAFILLATAARTAYGADWQKRVEVKVLSNLGGGLPYALKVLRAAHAAGFTTIILPRGFAKWRRINEPFITYNRGGRV